MDFNGVRNKTPIHALIYGTVVMKKDQQDKHYGLSLLIQGNKQEDGKNMFYLLGHMSRYAAGIIEGSTVYPGMTVGYVGNSGNCQTGEHTVTDVERKAGKGSHLHLSVYKTNKSKGYLLYDENESDNYKTKDGDIVNPFNHNEYRKYK